MTVKKDASGRRSIEVQTLVPGTPEEVWQAIATGPGISAWFVPTEFQERDGVPVTLTMHFGPGMDDVARVTAWDPPRRVANVHERWRSARDGMDRRSALGRQVPRPRRSGIFSDTDDWDGHLESMEGGWSTFFRILNLYLAHFRGQRATTFRVMSIVEGPASNAWDTLTGPLDAAGAVPGRRWTSSGDLRLSGFVEPGRECPKHTLLLASTGRHPGCLGVRALDGKQIYAGMDFLLRRRGRRSCRTRPAAVAGVAQHALPGPRWRACSRMQFC